MATSAEVSMTSSRHAEIIVTDDLVHRPSIGGPPRRAARRDFSGF
jgi:hypothetical protein